MSCFIKFYLEIHIFPDLIVDHMWKQKNKQTSLILLTSTTFHSSVPFSFISIWKSSLATWALGHLGGANHLTEITSVLSAQTSTLSGGYGMAVKKKKQFTFLCTLLSGTAFLFKSN